MLKSCSGVALELLGSLFVVIQELLFLRSSLNSLGALGSIHKRRRLKGGGWGVLQRAMKSDGGGTLFLTKTTSFFSLCKFLKVQIFLSFFI